MNPSDGGAKWTPGPWPLGEIDDHLGYDCMTSGIRIGPVYLDGAQWRLMMKLPSVSARHSREEMAVRVEAAYREGFDDRDRWIFSGAAWLNSNTHKQLEAK